MAEHSDDSDFGNNERELFMPEYPSSNIVQSSMQSLSTKKIKKPLLISSLIGIFFNMVIGTLLHFTFEWFGCWAPIGAFMPVNESVGEHLNMHYWPIIWYALLEMRFIRPHTNYIVISKFVNVTMALTITLAVFYIYTIFINHNVIIDIIIFYCAVIIGQLVGYWIFCINGKPSIWLNISSVSMLILYGLLLIISTFAPTNLPIHVDSNGQSGIKC